MTSVEFRTSPLGRAGYLAMLLVTLFPASFLLMGFGAGWPRSQPWTVIALIVLVTLVVAFGVLYSAFFLLWPGWRVLCTEEGIAVLSWKGLRRFKWSEIARFEVRHTTRSSMTFLYLWRLGRRRPYHFDISGLRPDQHVLTARIRRALPQSADPTAGSGSH